MVSAVLIRSRLAFDHRDNDCAWNSFSRYLTARQKHTTVAVVTNQNGIPVRYADTLMLPGTASKNIRPR